MRILKHIGLAIAAGMMMSTTGCIVLLDEDGRDAPPPRECFGEWGDCEHDKDQCECEWYGDCDDHKHGDDDKNNQGGDKNNSSGGDDNNKPGGPKGDPDAPCDDPNPTAVCGEDGVTYMTRCDASRAHVRVAYTGECKQACTTDNECDAGSLCEAGFCEETTCPTLADDDFTQEVCGNDDFTYKTSCEARMSRVGVKHEGCCI